MSDKPKRTEKTTGGATAKPKSTVAASAKASTSSSSRKATPARGSSGRRKRREGSNTETVETKTAKTLTDKYAKFVERTSGLQDDAATQYNEILHAHMEELNRLQTEMAAADPTSAFLSDVMKAYKVNDAQGVADAYKKLHHFVGEAQSKIQEQYSELAKSYQEKTEEMAKSYRDTLLKESEDYGKEVTAALKKIDYAGLDASSKWALAQGLMVAALAQTPDTD